VLLKTLFLIVMLLAPAGLSVGERYYEPAGGFSLCPPAGWVVREAPGQKFKVMLLLSGEMPVANVLAKEMEFDGSLEEFVSGNLSLLSQMSQAGRLKGYRLLGRSELTTESGAKALKAVTEQEIGGHALRQTFYAFEGPAGRKIFLTATVPAAATGEYDKALDESAKTFRLEGPPAAAKP
jgi:hypothetical protein